jgi:hypothetical protein
MPTLLSLPQELLDEIIGLVVTAEIPHSSSTSRIRIREHRKWAGAHHVFVPDSADSYRPSSLSLLYTSKRVRADTLRLIEREETDAVVDLAVIDRVWLWPTYRTLLPRTATILNSLVLNVSLASSDEAKPLPYPYRNQHVWGFIRRFLSVGPVGDVREEKELDIRIETVRINLASEVHNGRYLFSQEEIPMRDIQQMAHLLDCHEWLYSEDYDSIVSWVVDLQENWLNSPETIEQFDWFREVCRRVRRIEICVDGRRVETVPVSEGT